MATDGKDKDPFPHVALADLRDGIKATEWITAVRANLYRRNMGAVVRQITRFIRGVQPGAPEQSGSSASAQSSGAAQPALTQAQSEQLYGLVLAAVLGDVQLELDVERVELAYGESDPKLLGVEALKAVLQYYKAAPSASLNSLQRQFHTDMDATDCTTAEAYLARVQRLALSANVMEPGTCSDKAIAQQVVEGLPQSKYGAITNHLKSTNAEHDGTT